MSVSQGVRIIHYRSIHYLAIGNWQLASLRSPVSLSRCSQYLTFAPIQISPSNLSLSLSYHLSIDTTTSKMVTRITTTTCVGSSSRTRRNGPTRQSSSSLSSSCFSLNLVIFLLIGMLWNPRLVVPVKSFLVAQLPITTTISISSHRPLKSSSLGSSLSLPSSSVFLSSRSSPIVTTTRTSTTLAATTSDATSASTNVVKDDGSSGEYPTSLQQQQQDDVDGTQQQQEEQEQQDLFDDFVDFLLVQQEEIIQMLEELEMEYHQDNVNINNNNTAKNKEEDDNASSTTTTTPAKFSRDAWGIFANKNWNDNDKNGHDDENENDGTTTTTTITMNNNNNDDNNMNNNNNKPPPPPVGGMTRVLQGGTVIEKGACSFTLIGQGILSKERAATIRARQEQQQQNMDDNDDNNTDNDTVLIQEGDEYAAAALSMVLHSRSPHVPTFRSDVRVFLVQTQDQQKQQQQSSSSDAATTTTTTTKTLAWFGGGADLTPYYLNKKDITFFHQCYADLCAKHWDEEDDDDDNNDNNIRKKKKYSYQSMKQACDEYFYLPARQEHRGTGGIFFDDMTMTISSLDFCKDVVQTWMSSWIPIVHRQQQGGRGQRQQQQEEEDDDDDIPPVITDAQRHWQLLRRGRYLEFNLLYDGGVRFGLAHANPRVEGVMVSAPPMIAFDYQHVIEPNSPEAELMQVLQTPQEWI